MIVQIIIVRNAVNRKNIKYDCLTPPKTLIFVSPGYNCLQKLALIWFRVTEFLAKIFRAIISTSWINRVSSVKLWRI